MFKLKLQILNLWYVRLNKCGLFSFQSTFILIPSNYDVIFPLYRSQTYVIRAAGVYNYFSKKKFIKQVVKYCQKNCYPELFVASTAALPLFRVLVTSICSLLLHMYQCSLCNSTLVHSATKFSRLYVMFKPHHISVICFG
jgi:hypothetical protein